MAWTNIDNALVSVGALPFATTIQALRDNPIAIANGDAGAPKVKTTSLQGSTAGTANLIMRLQEATVSSNDNPSYLDVNFHNRISAGQHLGVTCLIDGTITAYLEHSRGVGSGGSAFVRVLKNGAQVQEWSTTSSGFVVRQVDVSVAAGDVIIFQQRDTSGGFASWRRLRVYSNTPGFSVA
jgi:hypothetical protein